MKSERAKAYISEKDELMQYSGLITTEYAEQAIDLAESDAEARCRERARNAFLTAYCIHCERKLDNDCTSTGGCTQSAPMEYDFLDAYDADNQSLTEKR